MVAWRARRCLSHSATVPFRFAGLTLTVASVERSLAFYHGVLGLAVAVNAAPAFALIRTGSGSIGLLSLAEAVKDGAKAADAAQRQAIHVEFGTDQLDALDAESQAKGSSSTSRRMLNLGSGR